MKAFALFYSILVCHVWLLALGSLFISEGKQTGNGSGGEWSLEGESWRSGRIKNYGQVLFY